MNFRAGKKFILCVAFLFYQPLHARLSSLAYNDPFPEFSTRNPYDLLYAHKKASMKGTEHEPEQRLSFAVSPFYQKAHAAKNLHRQRVELGEIHGRWNMIGLLYGDVPCEQTRGGKEDSFLQKAFEGARFCEALDLCDPSVIDVNNDSILTTQEMRFFHDPQFTDTAQRFGFFSVPMHYRKVGLRFEMIGMLTDDIGVDIKFGIADINQVLMTDCKDLTINCEQDLAQLLCADGTCGRKGLIDLTLIAEGGTSKIFNGSSQNVAEEFLMTKATEIFTEIGLNVCDFHETSVEDLQASLFWRHAFSVNKNKRGYPEFLFIPFVSVDGSIGLSKHKDPSMPLATTFGNNSHHAAGFSVGFTLDFKESVEIGIEAGGTHFFDREFCDVFVPTHDMQSGIFPFKTDICVSPGTNWHFTALLNAYHYMDRLSFHAQYIFVTHEKDKICLLKPNNGTHTEVDTCTGSSASPPITCSFTDPTDVTGVFKPDRLAKDTPWSSQMIDIGFNYDISPYGSLGFLWQIPVTRKNAYRANTVMASFEARF